MKKLNEEVLQVGDIILTTTQAKGSKGIRLFTASDVSHAMIYVEEFSVVDATSEGVHARNSLRLLWEDESPVHVLRVPGGLNPGDLYEILKFTRSRVGTPYSVREAIATVLGPKRSWSRKQFCSRLVAQAYASVGIHLVENPNYCSPEQIRASAALVEIPDSTIPVPQEYADALKTMRDFTQEMRAITN